MDPEHSEIPRLYLSRVELRAMLLEILEEKFAPEFYALQQSMLEVRARLGGLAAMLEASREERIRETTTKAHALKKGL